MMRLLTAEFFQRSPLLIFPLVALIIFFVVYVGIALRTYTRKKDHFDPMARLPLDESGGDL